MILKKERKRCKKSSMVNHCLDRYGFREINLATLIVDEVKINKTNKKTKFVVNFMENKTGI